MAHRAYVALGANVGDREAVLLAAVDALSGSAGVWIRGLSSFHETDPVGGPTDQDRYLNAAVGLDTDLSAWELMNLLERVEASLGRDRSREVRWGPRTCDLDLLLYDQEIIDTPELTVPHPRMHERRFVLAPLAELAAQAVVPTTGRSVEDHLRSLDEG